MILQNLFTKIAKHQLGAATTLCHPPKTSLGFQNINIAFKIMISYLIEFKK
jgi:hypothetical protein